MYNYIKKHSSILFIILQALLIAVAFELGGWFLILYIVVNIIWGIYWAYKNRDLLFLITDMFLGQATGKAFYRNKVVEDVKKKRKKD